MTSNISSSTTGHPYRHRPMPINNNSNITGQSSNTNMNNNSNSLYYGSSTSAAPTVAPPTWTYSSPSHLARKYANIAPIWCHITKPRQLKKKFASTFHPAQSLVSFYNEERAPSERRNSLNQSQQQNQNQSQQQPPIVHNTSSTPHHHHHTNESNSYRQPYIPHYPTHDLITEPSIPSSSSRAKKKYTGGALTMHLSSSRLQSPPPSPISSLNSEEKFSNAGERKARIDQLKDLVFNTRVKDTMVGRTDSKNRSTTNLHKANSYKRIDQITNPIDDYQPSVIPPTTPTRKDSHYYHYHLPSSTISSTITENLNRPIVPPPPSSTTSTAITSPTPHPTYNYDYLRAKSKEHTRPTYYEPTYITSPAHTTEIPSSSLSSQIGSSSSAYVGSTITANPLNSYRTFDDYTYVGKPSSVTDKNSSYTAITSYPSYQTPGSSKRRIKKYLLAKGGTSATLSHQTEPILTNFENLSLHDEDKITSEEGSSTIIANTHAVTSPSPLPSNSTTMNTTVVPSLQSTPPIPIIPTLSPPSSPPPVPTSSTAVESVVFLTPNAQLSPSPQNNNTNNKIPPVILVPLSASLTSLDNQEQQQSLKSTTNSLLDLVLPHSGKEQSPSRSLVPPVTKDGWEFCVCVSVCILRKKKKMIAVLLKVFEIDHSSYLFFDFCMYQYFACVCSSSTPPRNNLHTSSSIERHRRRRHNRHDSSENRHGANTGGGTTRGDSIKSTSSASKRHKKTNNLTNNHTNNNYHHHHYKRSTSSANHRVSP
jgi:hypothetical protein